MKKNLLFALALAASTAAVADTVTYNDLLQRGDGWTLASGRNRGNIQFSDGTASAANSNWGQGTATYTLSDAISLRNPGDTFSFSYTLNTNGTIDAALTLSFIGSTGTVVTGMSLYSAGNGSVQYGYSSSDTTVHAYAFGNTNWDNNVATNIEAAGSLGTASTTDTFTISGTVSWQGDQFVMSLGDEHTLNLGSGFEVSSLAILIDGPNSDQVPSMSGLTLTATTAIVPEPATATLSLLALAGLAARRRRK